MATAVLSAVVAALSRSEIAGAYLAAGPMCLLVLCTASACKSAPQSALATPQPAPIAQAPPTPQPTSSALGAKPPERAHLEPQPFPGPTLLAPVIGITLLDRFRASVDSLLDDQQFRNARWGVLIVDPVQGDTLYQRDADKLFMPASNQKLVTMAVGLTQLGASYQWKTPVEMRGVVRGGTLTGDIVVRGRGDPSWSDAMQNGTALSAFAPIADALAGRGITRVVGNILAEDNAFSDSPYGFGWAFDDFDEAYSAPIDELMLNEGFFTLTIRAPRKLAGALTASTSPTRAYPRVIVQAVARGRSDSLGENGRLVARWDSTVSAIVVRGTLPMGDSARFELPYRHPDDAVIAGIRQVLNERGIAVSARDSSAVSGAHGRGEANAQSGTAARDNGAAHSSASALGDATVSTRAAETLSVLKSPPLGDVLKRLAKPSQNQIAEALFKTIGLGVTGVGRADSARAVIERQLVTWGIPTSAIAVRDGSGLSRHDYVAPRTLVQVLDIMRKSPSFDAYYSALPIAGVDGTLISRMRSAQAANNLHAKTGTVDKARALSGYVTTSDGQLLLFSFMCNNFSVPTKAVEHVQDAIANRLAELNLRDVRKAP